jgi:superfamily I DNA/RNA helicase
VNPVSILVLTFSNKAANELSERLAAKNPTAAAAMWIGMRIPVQSCHPFQTNAATHSILKLPLIPVNVATLWW